MEIIVERVYTGTWDDCDITPVQEKASNDGTFTEIRTSKRTLEEQQAFNALHGTLTEMIKGITACLGHYQLEGVLTEEGYFSIDLVDCIIKGSEKDSDSLIRIRSIVLDCTPGGIRYDEIGAHGILICHYIDGKLRSIIPFEGKEAGIEITRLNAMIVRSA